MQSKIIGKASLIKTIAFGGFMLAAGFGTGYVWLPYRLEHPQAITVTDTSAHFRGVKEPVVLYSTQWCPYCEQARKYFRKHHIAYFERDIEAGSEDTYRLYSSIGQKSVPQIIIGNKILHGFEPKLIEDALNRDG